MEVTSYGALMEYLSLTPSLNMLSGQDTGSNLIGHDVVVPSTCGNARDPNDTQAMWGSRQGRVLVLKIG